MEDKETISSAKLKLKYLIIVNAMVSILALTGGYFGGINTAIYFSVFMQLKYWFLLHCLFLFSLFGYLKADQLKLQRLKQCKVLAIFITL